MSAAVITRANLDDPRHQAAVLALTRSYARDPMGSGRDLPEAVRHVLVDRLRAHPTTLILLAFEGDEAVGIATCFLGFSTFTARPLVNIHDLHVVPEAAGRGLGRRLLEAVETEARKLGCCKITLEVLENNTIARGLYERVGFTDGHAGNDAGTLLFREKQLEGG